MFNFIKNFFINLFTMTPLTLDTEISKRAKIAHLAIESEGLLRRARRDGNELLSMHEVLTTERKNSKTYKETSVKYEERTKEFKNLLTDIDNQIAMLELEPLLGEI